MFQIFWRDIFIDTLCENVLPTSALVRQMPRDHFPNYVLRCVRSLLQGSV
jgi:hypothetical protein